MSTISSVTTLGTGLNSEQNERVVSKTLDQEDFLQIMLAQLTNQDPTDPADTGEMLQQMCSLSMVQSMSELQSDGQMTYAQSLLGKTVTVCGDDNESVTGTVSEIRIIDDEPNLVINDTNYEISTLQAILSDG